MSSPTRQTLATLATNLAAQPPTIQLQTGTYAFDLSTLNVSITLSPRTGEELARSPTTMSFATLAKDAVTSTH